VTTTISPPIRILALAGTLAALALGILFYMHSRSSSDTPSTSATPSTTHTTPTTKPKPAQVAPKVVLLPGLPSKVAHALRHSKVVVVSIYATGGKGDHAAIATARKAARSVHVGFVAVNVANEKTARAFGTFAGTKTAPPAVLVVKRPGRIVNRFDTWADSPVIAQAARDARVVR
jgi:hypothetical protein